MIRIKKQYDNLNKLQNLQLEISNIKNLSNYTYNLNIPIENVISIKKVFPAKMWVKLYQKCSFIIILKRNLKILNCYVKIQRFFGQHG